MGIGVGLFLLAVGAVLAFAVTAEVQGVDLQTVGWILMALGAAGILLSLAFWSSWGGFGGRRRVVEEEPGLLAGRRTIIERDERY